METVAFGSAIVISPTLHPFSHRLVYRKGKPAEKGSATALFSVFVVEMFSYSYYDSEKKQKDNVTGRRLSPLLTPLILVHILVH